MDTLAFYALVISYPVSFARQFNPGGSNDHGSSYNDSGVPIWPFILGGILILLGIGVMIASCCLFKRLRDFGKRICRRRKSDPTMSEQRSEFIPKEGQQRRSTSRGHEETDL